MSFGDTDLGPMVGTKADDVLSVDTSVSFSWVPDPGNASSSGTLYFDYDTLSFQLATTTGPSSAIGSVTFDVPSSRPFTMGPEVASFRFTSGAVYSNEIYFGDHWNWNPMTGILDPAGSGAAWDDVIQITFDARSTHYVASHFPDYMTLQELGHWTMVSDPIDVAVFGGTGNDTIYGGQGQETLSGDAGDDLIYVGRGNDLVFGGSGSDEIHGGMGTQVLDGGAGSDTIWGGSGTQTIMGDGGDDLLIAGAGAETVMGGAGRDTIWGGSGSAYLGGGGRGLMFYISASGTKRWSEGPGGTCSRPEAGHRGRMSWRISWSGRTCCRSMRSSADWRSRGRTIWQHMSAPGMEVRW